ncbi:hypothetical protein ABL78_5984 [Leptomonas seymouri]|uniref:Uncharacterized protein n=1 Tax=Leptomonas seymouri TaxID=5684 RepID=A0A0N0P475_LEPSE|nr:hypothetical protein ABL78_5984 [Leptomonas seymouri]|eukprot:KPI84969.1 hypothetical protein ABL78_5984 [Leptomonas seymouri]
MEYRKQFETPCRGERAERGAFTDAAPPLPSLAPPSGTGTVMREPVSMLVCGPVPVPDAVHERRRRCETPLYPPPIQRSRCRTASVTAFRLLVAAFATAMAVFAVVGQVLPFCDRTFRGWKVEYAVWRQSAARTSGGTTWRNAREGNTTEKVFSVLSAVFSLIACVLCSVFVGLWLRYEQERRREADAYEEAQRYAGWRQVQDRDNGAHRGANHHNGGRLRSEELHAQDSFKCDSPTAYPRVFGTKEEMYKRERQRRRVDRDVGVAAFSFLIAGAAASLVTMASMMHFYVAVTNEGTASRGYVVGFALFVAAFALGVVAFVLLALPCLTDLYLCCGPQVETPKTPSASSRWDSADVEGLPAAAPVPQPAGFRNTRTMNSNAALPERAASSPFAATTHAYRSRSSSPPPPPETRHTAIYQDTRAPPPPAPPQAYVPAVVGTYPEALPGPTSMAHLTLHHVSPDGTTTAMYHPTAQGAWQDAAVAPGLYAASLLHVAHEAEGGYASGGFYTAA